VLCLDHPGVQAIVPRMSRRTLTYGTASQADLVATEIAVDGLGMRFAVRARGALLGSARVRLTGQHNVRNALAALSVALELGVPFAQAADALDSFGGIERRFQIKGDAAGVRVVDDYGHHPAEVRATLAAARAVHAGRIVVAFQPHRYTRTRDLWDDFARSFNDADVLLLTEIYGAGEDKIPGVDAAGLVEALRAHGHRDVEFVADLDQVLLRLAARVRPGDLVLTLGAGSVSSLSDRLLARLRGAAE
jgi:UDP-N-acetylmuramate--alanine ligase